MSNRKRGKNEEEQAPEQMYAYLKLNKEFLRFLT